MSDGARRHDGGTTSDLSGMGRAARTEETIRSPGATSAKNRSATTSARGASRSSQPTRHRWRSGSPTSSRSTVTCWWMLT